MSAFSVLPFLVLGGLLALALSLFVVGARLHYRINRITVERNPELARLEIAHLSGWKAAGALERHTASIERRAADDPETRRLLRLRKVCYIAAAVLGFVPLLYMGLFLDYFMQ